MPILMHFIILFGAYAHLMSNPNVGICDVSGSKQSYDQGGTFHRRNQDTGSEKQLRYGDTDRHLIICTKQKPNLRRIFYDPIICINLIGTENRAIMKTRSLKGGLEIEANQVTHKQQRVVITPDLAYLGYRRQSMTPRKASVSRAAAAKVAAGRSIKG